MSWRHCSILARKAPLIKEKFSWRSEGRKCSARLVSPSSPGPKKSPHRICIDHPPHYISQRFAHHLLLSGLDQRGHSVPTSCIMVLHLGSLPYSAVTKQIRQSGNLLRLPYQAIASALVLLHRFMQQNTGPYVETVRTSKTNAERLADASMGVSY